MRIGRRVPDRGFFVEFLSERGPIFACASLPGGPAPRGVDGGWRGRFGIITIIRVVIIVIKGRGGGGEEGALRDLRRHDGFVVTFGD